MSENTFAQEIRLTRHRELQNGMELILGKLKHNAKSITTEDARSLADNAEEGDEWTANIIAAVNDLATRSEAEKAALSDDHLQSSGDITQSASSLSRNVIERLRSDPSSITEEDARRFSENIEARDASSARLISAVESLAAAHNDIYHQGTKLRQSPHPSLLTVVKDLYAAVEMNPGDVNPEILKTTQSIVSKMQKAIGHTNAPHPELEAELQQEYAKIVPKVERGVVTKAEADRLHSLEARTHGHTERGGLTAIAQSVAARCERRASISSSSGDVRSHANSRTFTPHKQLHHDTGMIASRVETETVNIQNEDVTKCDVDHLRSSGQHSPQDGRTSAVVPSTFSARRYQSFSDSTNTTHALIEDPRKHSAMNSKLAGLSVHDEEDGHDKHSSMIPQLQSCGSGDKSSSGLENMPHTYKRENNYPAF